MFLFFEKSVNLNLFIKFVLESKTNKEKTAEICPPLLLRPTVICARAIQRAAKGSNFKEDDRGFVLTQS